MLNNCIIAMTSQLYTLTTIYTPTAPLEIEGITTNTSHAAALQPPPIHTCTIAQLQVGDVLCVLCFVHLCLMCMCVIFAVIYTHTLSHRTCTTACRRACLCCVLMMAAMHQKPHAQQQQQQGMLFSAHVVYIYSASFVDHCDVSETPCSSPILFIFCLFTEYHIQPMHYGTSQGT